MYLFSHKLLIMKLKIRKKIQIQYRAIHFVNDIPPAANKINVDVSELNKKIKHLLVVKMAGTVNPADKRAQTAKNNVCIRNKN